MTKYNFLCADIGTTSLKAALVSDKGQVLSFSKIEFSSLRKLWSKNTYSIARFWLPALQKAIKNIKKELHIQGALCCDAVCISGNGPTIVSEDGTTFLWSDYITAQIPPSIPEKYKDSLFLPRLLAFKILYPEIVESQKIFSGPEYLIWQLSNSQITILPEARYTAAYWTDEDLQFFSIPSPGPFVPPGFDCGNILPKMAKRLSLSANAKIIAGGPDFTVAMIGTNSLTPGKLCDRAGSSEGINWCTENPVTFPGMRTLPSVIPGLWNASFLIKESGTALDKAKQDFEKANGVVITYDEFIKLCLDGSCDSDGNTNNACNTSNGPAHSACITTNDYFTNSVHNTTHGAQTLKTLTDFSATTISTFRTLAKENSMPIADTVTITGGQAKNERWLIHKATACKINFGITEVADSELIGDAVLAAFGLGLYNSIQEAAEKMVKIKCVFKPEIH